MKFSNDLKEKGVVIGNRYDKYGSKNILVKRVMKGFSSALADLIEIASPEEIHDIGCGEGFWVFRWIEQGYSARGCDFSSTIIEIARSNAKKRGVSPDFFSIKNIYELNEDNDKADLVVCCEVLEHLEDPEAALNVLQKVVSRYIILSVPREPLWRLLNMARASYLTEWGNTPGHIQHWSLRNFITLIDNYFEIIEIRTPLPWTILLCRSK
jgi:2-polyprenyl-3-methyl-5-hydroxy-6-metoxy-1,4-benzoquinol methylase